MLDSYWTSGIKATSAGSHVNECGWHCQTGDLIELRTRDYVIIAAAENAKQHRSAFNCDQD